MTFLEKRMRPLVLVACEFSATVRDAFRARGFDAWSCDLLPTEGDPQFHIQRDVTDILTNGWDLLIAHPPCTYLTKSGARWWKGREKEQSEALDFVRLLLAAPVPFIALENPPGRIGTAIRKADQTIQPWQFGHGETKATSFWLKGLPPLKPTDVVAGREPRVHHAAPGPDRWKVRSRTLPGIAAAMADQWGAFVRAQLSGVSVMTDPIERDCQACAKRLTPFRVWTCKRCGAVNCRHMALNPDQYGMCECNDGCKQGERAQVILQKLT